MNDQSALGDKYDVVIVGGRPAGASLAAHLGARGLSVLVIDKAAFPSAPSVPSCPVIYPSTMKLLDELGIDERDYAGGAPKLYGLVVEVATHFTARFPMISSCGRDYFYGVDRAELDLALFQHLARYPTVTARQEVAMTDLLRDAGGRVLGVVAQAHGQPAQRVLADWVVGADGRFSLVARKAGARVTEEFADRTSTVYFADWEGVAPYDETSEALQHVYITGRGTDVLHIPTSNGRTTICTHTRADRADVKGDPTGFYLGVLHGHEGVRRRVAGARRVSPVVGMKRVGNRYLSAGGPGWVLVGDALHHKDPVDGQGIYDALVQSKILAEAIGSAKLGERTAAAALAFYERRVLEETRGMFLATMDRLKRELYQEPPELLVRTTIRWMMTDPIVQKRFFEYVCRSLPPETWLSPAIMSGAFMRGALGDLRRLLRRAPGLRRQAMSAGSADS